MKIRRFASNTYEIQEEGLMSLPEIGEARLIPVLVVNSKYSNKLKELIHIHQTTPPGDAVSYWSRPTSSLFFRAESWYLHIEFSLPMKYEFQVKFNLYENYSLIDAVMMSQAVHLSYGNKGDKISKIDNEKILVEIPEDEATLKLWNKRLDSVLKKKFNKLGYPKDIIGKEVVNHKKEMRDFLLMNMNSDE